MVVLDKERVHLASRLAAEAGVRPQMRRGGVLTIAPQTLLYDRAPEKEADALQHVAMALLQFASENGKDCTLSDCVHTAGRQLPGDEGWIRRIRRYCNPFTSEPPAVSLRRHSPAGRRPEDLAKEFAPSTLVTAPSVCSYPHS